MQSDECRSPFGDQQDSRRVAVEAMDELEKSRIRTRRSQLLDQSVRDAAAAVNRQTRGLVYRKYRVVLEQDAEVRDGAWRAGGLRRSDSDGRDTDDIASGEPTISTHAAFVHSNFAGSKHPVNVALWDTLEHTDKEIVDSLASRLLADGEPTDSILA
jgi:hypothetical protein